MTYYEELEAAGHILQRDDTGKIDNWVLDFDYHNGPGCINCEESWCSHCGDTIEPCIGKEAYEANAKAYRYKQYLKLKEEFDD